MTLTDGGRLLATTGRGGRDEHAAEFAGELALGPELTGGVPERLELCGVVAVTGGNTEEEPIERSKLLRCDDLVVWLGGRVHLRQDILRKRLRHPSRAVMLDEGSMDIDEITNWKI
jgi:hypothetical protein